MVKESALPDLTVDRFLDDQYRVVEDYIVLQETIVTLVAHCRSEHRAKVIDLYGDMSPQHSGKEFMKIFKKARFLSDEISVYHFGVRRGDIKAETQMRE